MPPYSCSNFLPSLHPIDENSSYHPNEGKDALQGDATQSNPTYRAPTRNTRNRQPIQRYSTSEDPYRLMMADVPTSPRPDVPEAHPGSGPAASLSSSQNQKAAAPAEQATLDVPSVDPDVGVEAEAAVPDDAPKLDPAGFFTLVSNSTANTTHHPTMKYIFLDDDPDILTSALATQHATNQSSTSASKTGKNPAPSNNRTILLDVVPDAEGQWRVSSAASLSADFAVTEASISRQEGEKEGSMVLKIDGVESEGFGAGGDKDKAESLPSSNSAVAKSGGEEYGPLLEDFERKMNVLRRVVKAGEGRAEKAKETKGSGGLEAEGKGEGQE